MSPKKDILGRLFEIEKSAVKTIAEADDIETVEALKVSLIGRREGRLSEILKKISDLEPETRREVGAESNRIKNVITEALSLSTGSVISSLGIGMLLMEGIGDTIRVSLSADP